MKTRTLVIAAATLAGVTLAAALLRNAAGTAGKTALDKEQRRELRAALDAAFATTLHAYETDHDASDFEERDARAAAATTALQAAIAQFAPSLGPIAEPCANLSAMLSDAQMQLMAFAINRKNRGTPDSAAVETENLERKSFKREAGPLYGQLVAALT